MTTAIQQFHAEDKSIEEILFSNNRYRVPRYQRPYSWSADQVEDFWNDLQEGGANTFLGSFVLNHETVEKDGYLEIIDGQQRLLTITIFMSLLRNFASTLGDTKFAERVQRQCIAIEDRRGSQSYRIKPGDSLIGFFEEHIQTNGVPSWSPTQKIEHKRIITNYEALKKFLEEEIQLHSTPKEKINALQSLWDRVAALRVIQIDIANEEDAYTIFETVNARGAELTVADLLKNLIFKNVKKSSAGEDAARVKWKSVEENVSDTGVDLSKFIRHFWLSKYSFTSERSLYRSIKRQTTDFTKLLDELVAASEWYNKLIAGDKSDWSGLNVKGERLIFEAVRGIRAMRVSQCYVLFLSMLRNAPKIGVDLSDYFKRVEKFTFRYSAVAKLQANRVEKLYSRKALEIEKASTASPGKHIVKNVSRSLDTLMNDLRAISPSLPVFTERFADIAYKDSEHSRIFIKYVLSGLNTTFATGEHDLDFDVVNIEHVLPRKPGPDWNLTSTQIKEYVNLLGNLTLVHRDINSKAGNRSARDKAKELGLTEIGITKDLVRTLERLDYQWDQSAIQTRHKEFATVAFEKVWADD